MSNVRPGEPERAILGSFQRSLLLVMLVATGASAGGDDGERAAPPTVAATCGVTTAAAVQAHYESVRDIDSRFTQTTRSVALGTGAVGSSTATTGRVLFAKPGKMRWAYETPAPSLVISDGKTLWIYDPASKEAQRFSVSAGYLTGAALSFLLGEGDLVAEFEVSAKSCEGAEVKLRLVPRGDSTYESLLLTVVRTSGEVLETSIVDLFGNVTIVAFAETRTNTDPVASMFEFEPPDGTQVIDLTP